MKIFHVVLFTVSFGNLFSVFFCKQGSKKKKSKYIALSHKILRKSIGVNNMEKVEKWQKLKISLGCFSKRPGDEKHLVKFPPCFF